jgi:hypothetical protein
MEKSPHPGEMIDRLRIEQTRSGYDQRLQQSEESAFFQQCSVVAKLARAAACIEAPTALDFNRSIGVENLQAPDSEDRLGVQLYLLVGGCESEIIATFSEDDLIEVTGIKRLTPSDLTALEAVLMHINNSEEK